MVSWFEVGMAEGCYYDAKLQEYMQPNMVSHILCKYNSLTKRGFTLLHSALCVCIHYVGVACKD